MKSAGFSLLEMLVVVTIVTILVGVALPYYFHAVESARITEVVTLWGRQKNWVTGASLSQQQADRITDRLQQTKLNYFTGQLVCREKTDPNEICWEAEFTQLKEDTHARYKLVTTHNFARLNCVPINSAGEDFCITQAHNENTPEIIGGEKAYWIK